MGRYRNKVWVLFKMERDDSRIAFRAGISYTHVVYWVQSKAAWQGRVEWERKKVGTLKQYHSVRYTFLAESNDKAMLEQLKELTDVSEQ